jgi:putative transposase
VLAVEIRRAYKTELDPNDNQRAQLRRSAGAARWAWNQALAVNQRYYRETGVGLTYPRMNKLLTTWKQHPANAWTYEVSNYCFQSALQNLNRAFVNFFEGRAKYPRFKSRFGRQSFRLYGTIRADDRSVRLPKIGTVRLKERDYIPEGVKPVSATVSERAGRWFVSFQIDEEGGNGRATGAPIGVDLGLTDLACASDGRRWTGPKSLQNALRKLAHVQRKLARQDKGSNRRQKTKERIGRLHWRISNIRENALHELTNELVGVGRPADERPSMIVLEDLRVKNMLANGHLARHISDAAWREIRRQLEYKCEWWGVEFMVVEAAYTSQTCNSCGHVSADNRDGKRFCCVACGHEADADVNAARNILAKGLHAAGKAPEAQNARGGSDKTRQGIAVHSPAKRESDRGEQSLHTVASGATPDHSAACGGV